MIYWTATSKKGVFIAEMQREMEIRDEKTTRIMAHRIRKAMADREVDRELAGMVGMDESLAGPSAPGKPRLGA